MSDTRYQVFVSSTYSDLKEERALVSQALMEMNCIPAGMELFPATDEEQFQFIKTIIDDSDYYVLIIGGRYGSITREGISFTEQEYDYAESKGIEICAFIHSSPDEIPAGKTESSPATKALLDQFKEKVSSGRLVKYWNDPKELPGKVVISLNSAIRRKPAVGWIRGNREAPPEALSELIGLRDENARLREAIKNRNTPEQDRILVDLNRVINLQFSKQDSYSHSVGLSSAGLGSGPKVHDFSISLGEIVSKIGYDFLEPAALDGFKKLIPERETRSMMGLGASRGLFPTEISLTKNSIEKVRLSLVATGILQESGIGKFVLGELGKRALFEIITKGD